MVLTRSLQTEIRRLHDRRGREQSALSLAEGVRLVEEALAAAIAIRAVVVAPGLEATPRGRKLAESLSTRGVRIERATDREFETLAQTEQPQGVLAVVEPRVWSQADIPVGRACLVLDGVQDPGNLGTMIRTAWSLGAAGVVALPGTVELANPKVLRASMGAVFRFPVVALTLEEFGAMVAERGSAVWVAAADGESVRSRPPPSNLALVVGNEGSGVGKEISALATHRVAVPLGAEAESLNVAIAAGILLYEVLRDD